MGVNYIFEINALNDWELTHPLSSTAFKVLLKLYYLANKERFPARISVSNRVLESLVGCSEDSLTRARNQLIQFGRIDYSGKKKQIPVYSIRYFTENTGFNPNFAGYSQGINQCINQGIISGNPAGLSADSIINKTIGEENKEKQGDIYTTESSEIRQIAAAIAKKQGHGGNIAYIEGVMRKLRDGGEEAVRGARDELERSPGNNPALGYQQHTYTEDDFKDIYYDPERDFLQTGCST